MDRKSEKGKVSRQAALLYNVCSLWRCLVVPRFVRRWQKRLCLRGWELRPDADLIRRRVDYCCALPQGALMDGNGREIRRIRLRDSHSCYWFDLMRYLRALPSSTKVDFIDGDTWDNPTHPVFAKARRLDGKADNCVLMNLDRRRHFLRVHDPIPFEDKEGVLFFRGDVDAKENRREFLRRWFGHPLCDLGDTSPRHKTPWSKERVSVEEHFRYKYILALEGHDVASALQWIMASNCVPVMPRPTVEGWLMHGALEPGVHFLEIAPDFSDVADKIAWANAHPTKAARIAVASTQWARQFDDPRREAIVSHLIADKFKKLVR